MFFEKARKKVRGRKLSFKEKLVASFLSIAAILLISSIISMMEYRRMNNYVSELVADDISSISVAGRLSEMTNSYNLQILALIGSDMLETLPEIDEEYFRTHCDSLRMSPMVNHNSFALADSVMLSYENYMAAARNLEEVLYAPGYSREWFFGTLLPLHEKLQQDINVLTDAIYDDLETHSASFNSGTYRSLVPGAVAVGAGLMLVLLLLYFLIAYYANPLERMLAALRDYRDNDRRYNVNFEGDDQLAELNEGISELSEENRQLRRRIRDLKK